MKASPQNLTRRQLRRIHERSVGKKSGLAKFHDSKEKIKLQLMTQSDSVISKKNIKIRTDGQIYTHNQQIDPVLINPIERHQEFT